MRRVKAAQALNVDQSEPVATFGSVQIEQRFIKKLAKLFSVG
jgi:hypothetical protein